MTEHADLAHRLRMEFCAGQPEQRAKAVKIAMVNPDTLATWLLDNFTMTVPRGWVAVEIPRVEAMFRLLIDSGDMTPMATRQLGKLLHPEDEEST